MSFRDFYAVTPLFTMQGADGPEQTFTTAWCRSAFGQDISAYLAERRRLLTASLARARAQIAVSPFLERQLARTFPCPFRVIEYGIRPFTPGPRAGRGGGLQFGCAGALIPQKGWRSVWEAFHEVRRRHPGAELHFHGGPVPDVPAVDGVTFHGAYAPEGLPRLYAGLDIAIIPSLFEASRRACPAGPTRRDGPPHGRPPARPAVRLFIVTTSPPHHLPASAAWTWSGRRPAALPPSRKV